jgi:hypothetical protein
MQPSLSRLVHAFRYGRANPSRSCFFVVIVQTCLVHAFCYDRANRSDSLCLAHNEPVFSIWCAAETQPTRFYGTREVDGKETNVFFWTENLGPIPMNSLTLFTTTDPTAPQPAGADLLAPFRLWRLFVWLLHVILACSVHTSFLCSMPLHTPPPSFTSATSHRRHVTHLRHDTPPHHRHTSATKTSTPTPTRISKTNPSASPMLQCYRSAALMGGACGRACNRKIKRAFLGLPIVIANTHVRACTHALARLHTLTPSHPHTLTLTPSHHTLAHARKLPHSHAHTCTQLQLQSKCDCCMHWQVRMFRAIHPFGKDIDNA